MLAPPRASPQLTRCIRNRPLLLRRTIASTPNALPLLTTSDGHDKHVERVPISPLALHPERGGPKDLPIVRVLVDDEEDEEHKKLATKPRLIIVGGGWGTFTTFTPLLPSAAVGTVRSLIEPIRKIIARLRGHFVQGKAVDLVMSERLLEGRNRLLRRPKRRIYTSRTTSSVIAVGSTSSTTARAGLEHCHQLKTIADAQKIRPADHGLPTTTPEERKRLPASSSAAGPHRMPYGVETAAEIYDFCQEDIHGLRARSSLFPPLELPPCTLNMQGKVSIHVIQSRSIYLTRSVHKKAIEVDAQPPRPGAPAGTVYAIGDCSTIETSVVSHLLELQRIPMAGDHLSEVKQLFDLYDSDADNSLSLNELTQLLIELGSKITSLPATAQVAAQQGKSSGRSCTRSRGSATVLAANDIPDGAGPGTDEAVAKPFRYLHLGSLAYIGNAAVFDLGGHSFMGGLVAMYAWRSVYWNEQGVWGRDLSRL
ncbi:hypothetical protein FB451DRAFT_1448156 [Mycena latifolia]|nr:hypothetical protein FB451DRAFT_1448156 [Mycena latifolia]